MIYDKKCAIWQTPAEWRQNDARRPMIVSPRAGGAYQILRVLSYVGSPLLSLDGPGKARLTTWLVNQRQLGTSCPVVTHDDIEAARNAQDMRVPQRVNRVLQFMDTRTRTPGDAVRIDPNPDGESDRDKVTAYYQLLAHSESIEWRDLEYLLGHLAEKGLVRYIRQSSSWHAQVYALTVTGFERLDELEKATSVSDKVFVAMWFNERTDGARDSIKSAIRAAGYEPIRVDEKEFTGRIDDEILHDIRKSGFVVADLTHGLCGEVDKGHCGARGSVYYEAGYAHALGKIVIFTCKDVPGQERHFDIRQYNTILWKDEEDLRERLEKRVREVISDGSSRELEAA